MKLLFLLAVFFAPELKLNPSQIAGERFKAIEQEFRLFESEPYVAIIYVYYNEDGTGRALVLSPRCKFKIYIKQHHSDKVELEIWEKVRKQLERRYQAHIEIGVEFSGE